MFEDLRTSLHVFMSVVKVLALYEWANEPVTILFPKKDWPCAELRGPPSVDIDFWLLVTWSYGVIRGCNISIFQLPIMLSFCPQILHKLLLWNPLGNMQTSQENFTTIVCAKFGGQTKCIMGNWKIENVFRCVDGLNSGILVWTLSKSL